MPVWHLPQPRQTSAEADDRVEALRIDKVDYLKVIRKFSTQQLAQKCDLLERVPGEGLEWGGGRASLSAGNVVPCCT